MSELLTVDIHLAPDERQHALERDIRAGFSASPKRLPPVWFYDARGGQLFDEITRLPEYYLTRAERSILEERSAEIVAAADADTLVELGSGTSEKTRLLLDAMREARSLRRFVALDVDHATLGAAGRDIADRYEVEVHAVVGDFHRHLGELPDHGRRLVAFLGSTIGNFTPAQRRRFFFDLDASLRHDDRLLLGTDLVKDRARLLAAYDDAAGVTAEFNRNVLRVINAELGGEFDPMAFDHVAVWNEDERWIEMRLRSTRDQTVAIRDLDLQVSFADGEELLTETCAKFTPEQVEQELWEAGFVVEGRWTDPDGDFLLTLSHPYC